MAKRVLIVGAGLTGACLARLLAEAGLRIKVIDERDHVAGNCYSQVDKTTGIVVHVHGPHIFHTDQEPVWRFVQRFSAFEPYIQRTKTTSGGRVYSLPVNLLTINQFFERALSPAEAETFLAGQADRDIKEPRDFEEQALAFLGERLYRAFFYGYTKKQWNCEPRELPASVLKRLPVRFNYNDNYFNHKYQAQPTTGYTPLVEKMLAHDRVELQLKRPYEAGLRPEFDHVFYSGPLDRFFEYRAGRLPYRSLDFEWFTERGDYQGCAVMNYADPEVPYTRIIEHKHFSYWQTFADTICNREIPKACGPADTPYYPVHFTEHNPTLAQYRQLARAEHNLTFVGRLGTFRYLDMEVALSEALKTAEYFLESLTSRRTMPALMPA